MEYNPRGMQIGNVSQSSSFLGIGKRVSLYGAPQHTAEYLCIPYIHQADQPRTFPFTEFFSLFRTSDLPVADIMSYWSDVCDLAQK